MSAVKIVILSALTATPIMAGYSAKRGFVADGCRGSTCTDVKLLNPGFYYDYNPSDKFADSSNEQGYPALFTPMHWCLPLNATIPSTVNTTFVLGPNEPNNLHNCNKPPSVIAEAWATVMAAYPTSILVSPATAGNGIPWLDQFFSNCTHLYGSKGCRISHVAVHDYTCDAPTLLAYLKEVHDRYNMPVWLTEFSCGDGAQNKPMKDHLAYMQKVVPMLDAADYVYRYAWMSARSANRGLFTNPGPGQTLSEVGKLYASL
jgi:hypothetical protein